MKAIITSFLIATLCLVCYVAIDGAFSDAARATQN